MPIPNRSDALSILECNEGEASAPVRRTLRFGYALEVVEGARADLLQLAAPDGRLCLTIRLDPAGPQVEVHGATLAVSAQKSLRLACESLEIEVETDISMRAGGTIQTEGFSQVVRARRGDVHVVANDDVRIDGERVHLNSPYVYRPKEGRSLMEVLDAMTKAPPPVDNQAETGADGEG